MQLKLHHISPRAIRLESGNSVTLSSNGCKEGMGRGSIVSHKLAIPGDTGRIDTRFKVLCRTVPAKLGNVCDHLRQHSIVPTIGKRDRTLRKAGPTFKHNILVLFSCESKQKTAIFLRAFFHYCSHNLNANSNDCNTKQRALRNSLRPAKSATKIRVLTKCKLVCTELSTDLAVC